MEPNNANIKNMLENCRSRTKSGSVAESARSSGSAPPNQFPGADALGGMDLAGLMSNPMIRDMANQFMQSGAMNDMMRDPSKMMEMAQQFMGANGAGADGANNPLASLMNNPEMAQLAQQFAGGANLDGAKPPGSNNNEQ
ncbi:Small glutamine-rich tetratricopeptide repeat-containing protein 2 [Entomophthora muscae]|uniref:Small glutamine-rich tetratricopeptide repeat-containing protein 2 n=1 Tax=Entomophthora muscae TaxID=34485 RepID=A0ACC2SAZ5_9FUNG|nr:Small glutamine-rich tetratricopeptide repeat-containing protein 2 [Entomophthora muscae]